MKTTARIALGIVALAISNPVLAQPPQPLRPDQQAFRQLYQEMVETDTSVTTGSCTDLAGKIAARFKAAGFADNQIIPFAGPGHPKEGGLVVVYPGTSSAVKPMLLLGHIDVVVAKREDWTRDPYKLVEEKGYFWGRGTSDMKAMDAIWVDSLIRLHATGLPARSARSSSRSPAARRPAPRSTARAGSRQEQARPDRGRSSRSTRAAAAAPTATARWSSADAARRREDRDQLPHRGDQPRRPQLRADQGQRHLRARRRADQAPRLRLPGDDDRHHARLLPHRRQGARRRHGPRHDRGRSR